MKKSILFIVCSAIVAIVLIAITFLGIVSGTKDTFSDSYMATLRTKYHVLKEISEPKIIIVAGSSGAFSIDNELLEKETGYPVANTSLHAGTGALFQSELAKANINAGDIVLLAYEWGWYDAQGFDSFGTDLIMMGIDDELEMYRYIPSHKYKDVLGYLFTFANKKREYSGSEGIYSRSTFDEKGNISIYRNSRVIGQWDKLQTVTDVHDAVISEKSAEYLKRYKAFVESKGAHVYMISPPTWDESVKCDYEDFERLKREAQEKTGIEYISDPVDYIFPAKYMFDGTGMYHCSTEGTIYRTELIVSDLEKAGIIEPKENRIMEPGTIWDYDYTKDYQSFTALDDGLYKLEAWGASGSASENQSDNSYGRGAYTSGVVKMAKGDVIYVYVGGQDGWNGGGSGEAKGGDSTDFRLFAASPLSFDSLKSRIMVAAGGGGAMYSTIEELINRGDGGTLAGYNAECIDNVGNSDGGGYGGDQVSGGQPGNPEHQLNTYIAIPAGFGYGGYNLKNISSGGGGGYFGGGAGIHTGNCWDGGGGGSSFISGYAGCDAIAEDSSATNILHTGQPIHYSGIVFTDAIMIDGASQMPSFDGDEYMIGNDSTGHARIMYLG